MDPISEGIDAEIEAEIQNDLEIGDNGEIFNNDQATTEMIGGPPAPQGRLRLGLPTQYQPGLTQRQYAPPYGVYQNPIASQPPRGESPRPLAGFPIRSGL